MAKLLRKVKKRIKKHNSLCLNKNHFEAPLLFDEVDLNLDENKKRAIIDLISKFKSN